MGNASGLPLELIKPLAHGHEGIIHQVSAVAQIDDLQIRAKPGEVFDGGGSEVAFGDMKLDQFLTALSEGQKGILGGYASRRMNGHVEGQRLER